MAPAEDRDTTIAKEMSEEQSSGIHESCNILPLPNRSPGAQPSISWSKRSLLMLIRGSLHLRATTPEHKIQDSPEQAI